jgi:predicted phosphodiesterase
MPKPESLLSKTARELRKKWPDKPTKALARILYSKNKLLFKDEEAARDTLRRIEGKHGDKDRKYTADKSLYLEGERPKNPYKLPDSDEEVFEPYFITGHKRVLVINDIHLPYHNIESITACFNHAKKEKPDAVFINGDLLDFHQLSYFQKDPRKKRFSEELDMFKQFFQTLEKLFKCKVYFKFGNHEERYDSFLAQKAGELIGVEEFSLESIIKARAEGIEVIRDKRLVDMNGLPFIHGHEFGRGVFSPVNAARGLFLQAKHSCVKGDCHTSSEHTEPNVYRKIMKTWSVGCLCGLTPKWLPLNKWNHGFAIVDLDQNGADFRFRNYSIYEGKVL